MNLRHERIRNATHMLTDKLFLNSIPPKRLVAIGRALKISGARGGKASARVVSKVLQERFSHRKFNDAAGFADIMLKADPDQVPGLLDEWEKTNPPLPTFQGHVDEAGRLIQD